MPRYRFTIAPLLLVAALIGCLETPPRPPDPKATSTKPKDNHLLAVDKKPKAIKTKRQNPLQKAKVKGSPAHRFNTPGALRWKLNMKDKITALRWSPLAGLAVSVGDELHNITSRGQDRWRIVAGDNHKLFTVGDEEVLWSPKFKRLTHVLRFGRTGWKRPWDSDLVFNDAGELFLLDAATVSTLGKDGKDRWRVSLEGMRRLEGPFPCDGGSIFHGIKGLERLAINISHRGSIVREINLDRGSILLETTRSCEPLIWNSQEVSLVDHRGISIWKQPLQDLPLVTRLSEGFLLAVSRPEKQIQLSSVTDHKGINWSITLPIIGRLTNFGLIQSHHSDRIIMGLCMNVSSPCANSSSTRGPYNAIVTGSEHNGFHTLVRHIKGHVNFAQYLEDGFVTASSSTENSTELTLRNNDGLILWTTTLTGRLTAGPHVGPNGEIYLATCNGWICSSPYTMYSVTGRKTEQRNDRQN